MGILIYYFLKNFFVFTNYNAKHEIVHCLQTSKITAVNKMSIFSILKTVSKRGFCTYVQRKQYLYCLQEESFF